MLPRRLASSWLPVLLAGLALPVHALDFHSLGAAAVMYDSPSSKGKPLYIINAGTPVEAVVNVEGWAKVRDMQGTLAWVEKKSLTDKRTVQVRVERAQVRLEAAETAALAFEAERDVVLDLLESPVAGWVKVRHRDGQSGFVKVPQVWGL